MEASRFSMSPREVGSWLSLLTTLAIYGAFFFATATGAVRGADQIGLLIGLVVLQVVVLVVIEIVLAIVRRRAPEADERDAAIDLRAYRNAYWVLAFSVASVTIAYVAWGGVASVPEAAAAGLRGPSVALVGNALLLCFVAAEIAHALTQVVLYRAGV
jgi:hypothetical protein